MDADELSYGVERRLSPQLEVETDISSCDCVVLSELMAAAETLYSDSRKTKDGKSMLAEEALIEDNIARPRAILTARVVKRLEDKLKVTNPW